MKNEDWICPTCCWFNGIDFCNKPKIMGDPEVIDGFEVIVAYNGMDGEGCKGTLECPGFIKIEEEENTDGST